MSHNRPVFESQGIVADGQQELHRQITENRIATKSLNRMTRLGRAAFKRAA